MLAYLLRRLVWIVITLWGVSLLTFGMLFAGPADAARALSGARAQARLEAQISSASCSTQPGAG